MVPGSILSIDLDTHGGEKNCSEQTGYPVSQGSAPGDHRALTIKGAFLLSRPPGQQEHYLDSQDILFAQNSFYRLRGCPSRY